MILITPILVMMAMGILEFGLAWRDSITVSSSLRAAARVGSNAGNDRLADYNTLSGTFPYFSPLFNYADVEVCSNNDPAKNPTVAGKVWVGPMPAGSEAAAAFHSRLMRAGAKKTA